MTQVATISSNRTAAYYAVEDSPKTLPGTPDWYELEPNSYGDFGAQITRVPRQPISADRQLKKGPITDLDASSSFQMDLTQENFPGLAAGFFRAAVRAKAELAVATVNTGGATDDFEPASGGDSYYANDLLYAQGFDDAANNGLHVVSGTPTGTEIIVTTTLTENTGQSGTIRKVGHQFASADFRVDASGTWPVLTTEGGGKDMTELGLIGAGEWLYIGSDEANTSFANAVNNGWVRVRAVAANALTVDKASATMATDTGSGKTIRIYFASRVLKNETTQTLIVQNTYQLERQLGAPDDAAPSEIQSEYVTGAVPNEFTLTVGTADKVVGDLSFVGMDYETRTGSTGIKTGNRHAVTEADAFNTSSSFKRLRMYVWADGDEFPSNLFTYLQDLALTLTNNSDPNKAVNVLGAASINDGFFQVTGQANAYFNNVAQQAAVRANSDSTLDFVMAQDNAVLGNAQGINIDVPLIGLGDGQNNVEQNSPMLTPVAIEGFDGAKLDSALSHTLWMGWWDYLPDVAVA